MILLVLAVCGVCVCMCRGVKPGLGLDADLSLLADVHLLEPRSSSVGQRIGAACQANFTTILIFNQHIIVDLRPLECFVRDRNTVFAVGH